VQLISAALWSYISYFCRIFSFFGFWDLLRSICQLGSQKRKNHDSHFGHTSVCPHTRLLPVAIAFFVAVFRGQRIGLELAAIFLIFTSQAWNIAFGVYETVKTLPRELVEVGKAFNLAKRLQSNVFICQPWCQPSCLTAVLVWPMAGIS